MPELARHLQAVADELLGGFRALVVNGPREAGKSTLVRHLQDGRGGVVDLDDPALLDLARQDPVGFVEQLPARSAIDEFQRAGDPHSMIDGMTPRTKITVTLPEDLVEAARAAVAAGRAASVSGYVAEALREKAKLDDLDAMLADMLAETGGPLTAAERKKIDRVAGWW